MLDDENDLAEAMQAVARAIRNLGNADAATPMGGLEALGKVLSESIDSLAASVSEVADAIRSQDRD